MFHLIVIRIVTVITVHQLKILDPPLESFVSYLYKLLNPQTVT